MDKPLSLRKKELQKILAEAVNNSGLPLDYCEYILRDILQEVQQVSLQQSLEEEKQYNDFIKSKEEENNVN